MTKLSERDVEMAGEYLRLRGCNPDGCPHAAGPLGPIENQLWVPGLAAHLAQAREEGRLLGLEQAAAHVENHSCVSSCCDSDPGPRPKHLAPAILTLADCIRALKMKP